MHFYRLDYTIDETLKRDLSDEQKILREYTGATFAPAEAKTLWAKILDHKWYVSERLRRDVGLRVAAVDYVENFYEPSLAGPRGRRRAPQNALSPTVFVA